MSLPKWYIVQHEGKKVGSYTTHFIDRVIGQTSASHESMRLGTPIADVKDALENPIKLGKVVTMKDGDVLEAIFDWINDNGFEPPHYYDYNDLGREAQKVYDRIYLNN